MLPTFSEKRGAGIHVVSEGNGSISREQVTVAEGSDVLEAGTIMAVVDGAFIPVALTAESEPTGSENAVAVLFGPVDATDDDVRAVVHARYCEVMGSELIYPEGANDMRIAEINADLAAFGIIVR